MVAASQPHTRVHKGAYIASVCTSRESPFASMEFLAATKDGIIIYDALSVGPKGRDADDWKDGVTVDDQQVKVVARIPSPTNAFGHAWSLDGTLLASVNDDGVVVYDAAKGYKAIIHIPKVAPDVGGRSGGVRNVNFSPKNNFLVSYEKWDPLFPENVHIWDLREGEGKEPKKLHSTTLKGYTSGGISEAQRIVKWKEDESEALELVPGKGIIVRHPDFSSGETNGEAKEKTEKKNKWDSDDEDEEPETPTGALELRLIAQKSCTNYMVSKASDKGVTYVSIYVPETASGMVARVAVFDLENPAKAVLEVHCPAKVKEVTMLFGPESSEMLALASCDVDESNSSYFGSTYLYWFSMENAKNKPTFTQVTTAKDGIVQDVCWSPTKNEFMIVVGQLPASVILYDGKTGKQISNLGSSRRNTLKWNPFGRFVAVGGFGTLPGDIDFFDRSCEETMASLRASLTVLSEWAPDGEHFLCSTVAPRMNEGNQLSVYKYNGDFPFQILFKPKVVEARHEDTGAGARTKTQAYLFWSSWRPMPGKFEDTPAPAPGTKRKKGLPEQDTPATTAPDKAFRPGGGGSLIAAMMRGEVACPDSGGGGGEKRWGDDGNKEPQAKPLEDWEIRKLERERKKAEEEKKKEAEAQKKQELRDVEKSVKDGKKQLKEVREKLAAMEELKEKDWDELTEEDEDILEGEADLRALLQELEKKYGED